MSDQLTFDLPHLPTRFRADFFVAPCNQEAAAWVDRWPDWPGGVLVLLGPPASGKSHLAEAWRLKADARRLDLAMPGTEAALAPESALLIEDVERTAGNAPAERRLFHLVNAVREAGRTLLVTARRPPAAWPIRLPDLASRLAACPLAPISPPDDALLAAVLAKHFSDRQVLVNPRVISYLAGRMERSFAEAARLVAILDRSALADGRAITVPLARRALEGYIDSGADSRPGGRGDTMGGG